MENAKKTAKVFDFLQKGAKLNLSKTQFRSSLKQSEESNELSLDVKMIVFLCIENIQNMKKKVFKLFRIKWKPYGSCRWDAVASVKLNPSSF